MTSPVQQVELAMLARLRDVTRPYTGLNIESYGAQLDDETFAWLRTMPASWVTFDKIEENKRLSKHSFKVSATFEVLVAQRALVENARRLGAPGHADNVGVYQLLEDNKLALVNQSLGLAIQPLVPGPVRSVMKGVAGRDAVAVYAQAFRTEWMEVYPEDTSSDPMLLSVGLNYLLKPGDDAPDSVDLVTTRTS